jgi:hypothetical protein
MMCPYTNWLGGLGGVPWYPRRNVCEEGWRDWYRAAAEGAW